MLQFGKRRHDRLLDVDDDILPVGVRLVPQKLDDVAQLAGVDLLLLAAQYHHLDDGLAVDSGTKAAGKQAVATDSRELVVERLRAIDAPVERDDVVGATDLAVDVDVQRHGGRG